MIGLLAALVRGLIARLTWIPTHAKCPRCGHWRGGILYDEHERQIVHCCRTCRALWAEEPLSKLSPKRKTDDA